MANKDKSTFELLDKVGKVLTDILLEEGLLLPGTSDKILAAKDAINNLKGRCSKSGWLCE
jgi:hypothetical protein